ncbi:hypothetical protein [Georgenia sp. MJ170]|uniref:hypothetical protein n=1 Tax=Georgenia sunbinii TaxID=3117728 RepID=UPI002F2698AC
MGAGRIAVNELAVAIADVIELNAGTITAGELGADRIAVGELSVAIANVIRLNASVIDSGTINTARLNVDAIAAAVANVIELNAERITTGELSADRIAVNDVFAEWFRANKITALEADLGSFAADEGFVASLRVATLTVGGPWKSDDIESLPASKIGTGTLGTARIPSLPASRISTGTLASARIPTLAQSKVSGLPAKLSTHDGTTARVNGWTYPGRTTIDGGSIETNSVKADQIDVLDLSALIVTSDMFVGNTFVGGTFEGLLMRSTRFEGELFIDAEPGTDLAATERGVWVQGYEPGQGGYWYPSSGGPGLIGTPRVDPNAITPTTSLVMRAPRSSGATPAQVEVTPFGVMNLTANQGILLNGNPLPMAMEAGNTGVPAGNTLVGPVRVYFDTGRFNAPPIVVATADASLYTAHVTTVTRTYFELYSRRNDGTTIYSHGINWIAVQMGLLTGGG